MPKPEGAWRIQVIHIGTGEWITMQPRYKDRATATSWLKFVKAAWHARYGRTITERQIIREYEKRKATT
jgi:hypothetical protein